MRTPKFTEGSNTNYQNRVEIETRNTAPVGYNRNFGKGGDDREGDFEEEE
jgi:hypothetical protein